MSDTNPLFDQRFIKAGDLVHMTLRPLEGRDSYQVEIIFPLDSMRVFASRWANPLRVALEAADEALNALRCQVFNDELNACKPYEKPKDEEKKDG